MKNIKVIIVLIFVSVVKLQAQEAIAVSGGNAIGSGGSVNFTLGQITYSTEAGSEGSIMQGVQIPFEIAVVLGIDEAKDIKLESRVYPNPTNRDITLTIENYEIKNLVYQIFDINGRYIGGNKIIDKETFISMENYVMSTYFIKIMKFAKNLKTFKIIKRN